MPRSVIRLIRRCDAPKLGKTKVNCERWIDFQEASRSHASLPITSRDDGKAKEGGEGISGDGRATYSIADNQSGLK